MKTLETKGIFTKIVKIQETLEKKFQNAGIDLSLITVMNNRNLPSFSSSISDAKGTSLDIEFKNKSNLKLTVHLLNRAAFGLSLGEDQTAGAYSLNRLDNKDFLNGLKIVYNKVYKNNKDEKRALFDFVNQFRK